MHPPQLDQSILSEHALLQMRRRGLDRQTVHAVLLEPESLQVARAGRLVAQARLAVPPSGAVYLVRVVVDVDRHPPEVVTAYRTRRFGHYGSTPP